MSEPTPGPWDVWHFTYEQYSKMSDAVDHMLSAGGLTLWWVEAEDNRMRALTGNGPTSEANARLVSAAPDLLTACEDLILWLDMINTSALPDRGVGVRESIAEARAAIAKAKGEQS